MSINKCSNDIIIRIKNYESFMYVREINDLAAGPLLVGDVRSWTPWILPYIRPC